MAARSLIARPRVGARHRAHKPRCSAGSDTSLIPTFPADPFGPDTISEMGTEHFRARVESAYFAIGCNGAPLTMTRSVKTGRIACGPPKKQPAPRRAPACRPHPNRELRTGVEHRDRAPVLRPARDVVAHRDRAFLAVGDRAHAAGVDAARNQIFAHRLRAL